MATVVLAGTLDSKGAEYAFVRSRLREVHEINTIVIDVGILGEPEPSADISRGDVAAAAGARIEDLVAAGDRGSAVETMARGLREVVARLYADGRLDGILGLGGSGGSSLVTSAMRVLPIGVPKLVVGRKRLPGRSGEPELTMSALSRAEPISDEHHRTVPRDP
jgi:uncharacterized protein (UPF0261 family)